MKQLILPMVAVFFVGCTPKTTEDLAKQVCTCYLYASGFNNTTRQLNTLDECYGLMQANLQNIQQMGIDNDWSPARVKEETNKFDNILNKCNGTTITR